MYHACEGGKQCFYLACSNIILFKIEVAPVDASVVIFSVCAPAGGEHAWICDHEVDGMVFVPVSYSFRRTPHDACSRERYDRPPSLAVLRCDWTACISEHGPFPAYHGPSRGGPPLGYTAGHAGNSLTEDAANQFFKLF